MAVYREQNIGEDFASAFTSAYGASSKKKDDSESQDLLNKVRAEYLQAQTEKLKADSDPRVQASRLANTLALLGDSERAERLFMLAGGGGGVLPSQQGQLQQQAGMASPNVVPDYLGLTPQGAPQGTAGTMLPSQSGGLGITSASLRTPSGTISLGRPAMSEVDKANLGIHQTLTSERLKTQQEDTTKVEKQVSPYRRLLQQYGRSYDELKKYDPNFDKVGFEGVVSRVGAKVSEKLDELPETSAYLARLKPFANYQARTIEGGRVTDNDRQIYADALFNTLKGPSERNVRLASQALIDLADKGGKIQQVVSELASSNVPTLTKIAGQVYEDYPELKPTLDVDDLLSRYK